MSSGNTLVDCGALAFGLAGFFAGVASGDAIGASVGGSVAGPLVGVSLMNLFVRASRGDEERPNALRVIAAALDHRRQSKVIFALSLVGAGLALALVLGQDPGQEVKQSKKDIPELVKP